MPESAGGFAGALAKATDGLACPLPDLADGLPDPACELIKVFDRLSRALADLAHRLAGALPQLPHPFADALPDLADRLAGAFADISNGPLGAFADVLDRFARLAKGMAGAAANVLDRPTEALHQLGIAINGGQDAIDDRGHVVQANLHQCLRLHPLDVELDLAEVHVHANVEVDQVEHLGLQSHVRLQVLELEVDLVDLDDRDVEEHVRVLAGFLQARDRVSPVFALGDGPLTFDVLGKAVLLGLL